MAIVCLSLNLPTVSSNSQLATAQSCQTCASSSVIHSPIENYERSSYTDCGCGKPACMSCQTCQPTLAPAVLTEYNPPIAKRGCGCKSCRTPKTRACRKCPNCNADVCKLKVEKGKEKKSRYTTEQKVICIPKVRLPWQTCNPCKPVPTCSKTRTVTVLKKESYECDVCKYSWEVQEPMVPEHIQAEVEAANAESIEPMESGGAGDSMGSEQSAEPQIVPSEVEEGISPPEPITPKVPEAPEVPDVPKVETAPSQSQYPARPEFEYYERAELPTQLQNLPLVYDR